MTQPKALTAAALAITLALGLAGCRNECEPGANAPQENAYGADESSEYCLDGSLCEHEDHRKPDQSKRKKHESYGLNPALSPERHPPRPLNPGMP